MFEIESEVTIHEMGEIINTLQSIDNTFNNMLLVGICFIVYKVAKDVFQEWSK